MPNTLVHLGIQGLVSRTASRDVDLRVVYLGCVIPDLPWIAQRAIRAGYPAIDRIDLALYSGAQSSLFFCLLLAAVIAAFTRDPGRNLAILAAGSAMHLLLDITQIKWGNGAMFLAPFSWRVSSLDGLWPEHPLFTVLTVASLGYVIGTWRRIPDTPLLALPPPAIRALAAAGLAVYLAAPAWFVPLLLERNTYDSGTLAGLENRTGKPVLFDRATLLDNGGGFATIRIFTGERLKLVGIESETSGLISVDGAFTAADTVAASRYRIHPPYTRDLASMIGLGLLSIILLRALWQQAAARRRPASDAAN